MTNLLFLDTETTGLDPDRHDVWELAFAVDDDPVQAFILPHSLARADATALKLNGYHERYPLGAVADGPQIDVLLREEFRGKTLVGANPAFDAAFLRARWGEAPWHYRMVDIESYAMAKFKWSRPRGLKDIYVELAGRGYSITQPDHTAAADVAALREAFFILTDLS